MKKNLNPLFLEENVKRKLYKQASSIVKKAGLDPTKAGDPDKIAKLLYRKNPLMAISYFSHVKKGFDPVSKKVVSLKADYLGNKDSYKKFAKQYKDTVTKVGKRNKTALIDDIVNLRAKGDKLGVQRIHNKNSRPIDLGNGKLIYPPRFLRFPKRLDTDFDPSPFYKDVIPPPKPRFDVEKHRMFW